MENTQELVGPNVLNRQYDHLSIGMRCKSSVSHYLIRAFSSVSTHLSSVSLKNHRFPSFVAYISIIAIIPDRWERIGEAYDHAWGIMDKFSPPIHPPIPLLVRSTEFVVDTTHSLVRDANLDECSEHEIEALGDSGLFDMIRALVRMSSFQIRFPGREASVKCLKTHLGAKEDKVQGYKEAVCLLNTLEH
ncbi:hypothetical protein SO802_017779 [Lithocarpus litseifolius]|uniref:Uncharacterized protein n=1 Tax=Lithocarpus litseifolius TaxID=425828 RepID=A0AAW2CIX3_9ROSI